MDDYTGAQRLLHMYRYLAEGGTVRPSQYAEETGVQRQSVYHQINLLRSMGCPIANNEQGEWTLGGDPEIDIFHLIHNPQMTGGQRLVQLYRDMVRGFSIEPSRRAQRDNLRRQTIYHQLDLLSQAGVEVVNVGQKWTLMEFVASYD